MNCVDFTMVVSTSASNAGVTRPVPQGRGAFFVFDRVRMVRAAAALAHPAVHGGYQR